MSPEERVAQAILARITEIGSEVAGRPIQADEFDEMCASQYARAALSAMPQRELLAEALEALSRLITASSHIHHWHDGHDGGMVVSGSHVHALWEETDRARAAADKIRAAMGGGNE